jgi:hypothetical protein
VSDGWPAERSPRLAVSGQAEEAVRRTRDAGGREGRRIRRRFAAGREGSKETSQFSDGKFAKDFCFSQTPCMIRIRNLVKVFIQMLFINKKIRVKDMDFQVFFSVACLIF